MKHVKAQVIMAKVRKAEDASRIAAYIVMKGEEHVGTIRIQYPRAGHGEAPLHAFLADWTLDRPEGTDFADFTRWQIGTATGYGYDKASAAMSGLALCGFTLLGNGHDWTHQLKEAGFTLMRAI